MTPGIAIGIGIGFVFLMFSHSGGAGRPGSDGLLPVQEFLAGIFLVPRIQKADAAWAGELSKAFTVFFLTARVWVKLLVAS